MTEMLMRAQVAMVLQEMSDEEVVSQRLAVLLNSDPRQRYGYDKAALLYTEADGTQMHEQTRRAFLAASGARLGV